MQSKNSILAKEKFIEYAQKNNFKFQDSLPLTAPEHSKLLFNISGGVIYQDELLEKKESTNKKIASIQKCIRTDNLKNIGISGRHHILFDMLGHFMFYAYDEKETKANFIKFAYTYLTKELCLDDKRIFVTAHPEDSVTLDIWTKLGKTNILKSEKNIFVSPYAEKSALRTEILWQKEDKTFVELWNLVFTQFNNKKIFNNPSAKIAADSGASLERIVSAIENKNNNYENSMWNKTVDFLRQSGQCSYDITQYRKLADLSNATIELVQEHIQPGNKTQSYVLRKLMRIFFDLCDFDNIKPEDVLNFLNVNKEYKDVFNQERQVYFKSVERGLLQAKKQIDKNGLENLDTSNLKSTYGLSEMYIKKIFSKYKTQSKLTDFELEK